MAKLIFTRALIVDDDTGQVRSYWPELWPLEALAREYQSVGGTQYFSPSYMCDPSSLGGNYLQGEWLHYYLPSDLEMARLEADVQQGHVFGGVDPAPGGESSDLDYCAMMAGERIGGKLYMRSYKAGRWPLAEQAKIIDQWMDSMDPSITIIEEQSSRGFVYTELTTRVRNGEGTPHAFLIERPKGTGIGAKVVRFMEMAARCRVGQILFPGLLSNGEIIPDPRWEPFFNQWRSFPAGHDDGLDSAYWCQWGAFHYDPAAGIVTPPSHNKYDVPDDLTCQRVAHVAFGRKIEDCPRCLSDYLAQQELERELSVRADSDELMNDQWRFGHGHSLEDPIGTPRELGVRRARTPGYRTTGMVGLRYRG